MGIKNALLTAAAIGAMAVASAAQAVTYQLDTGGSSFSGQSSWGSVTLTDAGSNSVQIVVDLIDGYHFVDTGSHEYFAFNTAGISVTLVGSAVFSDPSSSATMLNSSPGSNSPFSTFQYAIVCDTCSDDPGGGNHQAGNVLTFTVMGSGLNLGSFAHNSTGSGTAAYFSADIIGAASPNGATTTGVVGSTGQTSVPEPATLGLLGLGLAGVGLARRRKTAA